MLETKRCIIRAFLRSDSKETKELYKSKEVRRYLGGIPADKLIETSLKEISQPVSGSYYWVVREKQSNDFIGLVSLDRHHDGEYLELSYQLLPKWWGCGYATEILQTILTYALHVLKLEKIIAETQTANTASCRLLEKVGMIRETTLVRFGSEQAIYSFHIRRP